MPKVFIKWDSKQHHRQVTSIVDLLMHAISLSYLLGSRLANVCILINCVLDLQEQFPQRIN